MAKQTKGRVIALEGRRRIVGGKAIISRLSLYIYIRKKDEFMLWIVFRSGWRR